MGAHPLQDDDPQTLGGYRLKGRLGEGGQGVVFLGEGPSGEQVAVKVLKTTEPAARARFAREMDAARQVAAFCTAAVLDAVADAARPYAVWEYIPGPSLQQRVSEQGPLRGGELERLAVNTASALAAIHGAGIVHRDFKPANVLLGPDGPRVVDFGIARAIDADTQTQLVGTPAYFAPEWLRGHPPTGKSDVFAWAGTMVFAATGRPPFGSAPTVAAIMHRITHDEPDLTGVPDRLQAVLDRCLSKDPAQRPTVQELMDQLTDRSAASGTPGISQRVDTLPSGKLARRTISLAGRPRRSLLIGLVVVLIGAGIVWAVGGDIGEDRKWSKANGQTASNGLRVPPEFVGTWSGGVSQSGASERLHVTLNLFAGQHEGTADYQPRGCRHIVRVTGYPNRDRLSRELELAQTLRKDEVPKGCPLGRLLLKPDSGFTETGEFIGDGLSFTSWGEGESATGFLQKIR